MDDIFEELGALGLSSRLKRLSDNLMQESARIYERAGIGFQPRWFPVYLYLYRRGPTSITGLAKGLGVSHPGINKIANELIKARLASPYRDRSDKRKRVLALTSTGRDKFSELEPLWQHIRETFQAVIDEGDGGFLSSLALMESSLTQRTFLERYTDRLDEAALQPSGGVRTTAIFPQPRSA